MTAYEEERARQVNLEQKRLAEMAKIKNEFVSGSGIKRTMAQEGRKAQLANMRKGYDAQDAATALEAQQLAGQGANQAAADERQNTNQLTQLSAANKMNTAAADTAFGREQLVAMQGGRAEAAQNTQKNLIEALKVTADMRDKDDKPLSPEQSLSMARVLVGGGGGGEAGGDSGAGLSFGGRTAQTAQGAGGTPAPVQASAAPQSPTGYMPGAGYSTIVPGQAPVQNAQTPEEAAFTQSLYKTPRGQLTQGQITQALGGGSISGPGWDKRYPGGPAGGGAAPIAASTPNLSGGTTSRLLQSAANPANRNGRPLPPNSPPTGGVLGKPQGKEIAPVAPKTWGSALGDLTRKAIPVSNATAMGGFPVAQPTQLPPVEALMGNTSAPRGVLGTPQAKPQGTTNAMLDFAKKYKRSTLTGNTLRGSR